MEINLVCVDQNWFHFVNKYVRDGLYRGDCTLHSILVSCPSNTYIRGGNYYKAPPVSDKGLKYWRCFIIISLNKFQDCAAAV